MKAVAILFTCVFSASAAFAGNSTLFDPKPTHPWNQLYTVLLGDPPPPQAPISPLNRLATALRYSETCQHPRVHSCKCLSSRSLRVSGSCLRSMVWSSATWRTPGPLPTS